jgi:hypothetical protein
MSLAKSQQILMNSSLYYAVNGEFVFDSVEKRRGDFVSSRIRMTREEDEIGRGMGIRGNGIARGAGGDGGAGGAGGGNARGEDGGDSWPPQPQQYQEIAIKGYNSLIQVYSCLFPIEIDHTAVVAPALAPTPAPALLLPLLLMSLLPLPLLLSLLLLMCVCR